MSLRSKTIEYAFKSDSMTGSFASAAVRDFQPITIIIPETGSRSFLSCFTRVYAQWEAVNITAYRIQCGVGTGLDTTGEGAAQTQAITNTGEQSPLILSRDVTSLFASSSAFGAGQTSSYMSMSVSITGPASSVCFAKVYITYTYDDVASSDSRIKTVRIPIESFSGSLAFATTRSFQSLPALDTWLPESNKSFCDIHLDVIGNTCPAAGTVVSSLSSVVGGTKRQIAGLIPGTGASAAWFYYNQKLPDWPTSTPVSFGMYQSGSALFDSCAPILVVTYCYSASLSPRVMNSVLLGMADEKGYMGGPVLGDKSAFSREFFIEEPNPSLSQSAVLFSFIDAGALAPRIFCGSQPQKTYTIAAQTVCGGFNVLHRIDDSGSVRTEGFTFGRGKNNITTNWYRTTNAAGSYGTFVSSMLYLNYASDTSSQSGNAENHLSTRFEYLTRLTGSAINLREFVTASNINSGSMNMADIPETNYYLNGVGYIIDYMQGAAASAFSLSALQVTGANANIGDGWRDLFSGQYASDAEFGVIQIYARAGDEFRKFSEDPDSDLLRIEIPRKYRWVSTATGQVGSAYMYYTYHTIKYDISGTISGYSGSASGLAVNLHRSDTEKYRYTVYSDANGAFSGSWYDNTIPMYAHVFQDATHVGRSADITASGIT
jgi:hypothetical protein